MTSIFMFSQSDLICVPIEKERFSALTMKRERNQIRIHDLDIVTLVNVYHSSRTDWSEIQFKFRID